MKTFIAGAGEVGKSLAAVLNNWYDVVLYDIKDDAPFPVDVLRETDFLNICFPYDSRFLDYCFSYRSHLPSSSIIIVHSSVPVGVTRRLGLRAVHSPVHGVHPNLTQGLLTFLKYVGANEKTVETRVSQYLALAGIRTKIVASSEASELSKLCCTLQYGMNIAICKEIEALCQEHGVPFDEVYGWNSHYNAGYTLLGKREVARPVLKPMPGPIGGHCVIPNAELLPGPLSDFLIERNEAYKND